MGTVGERSQAGVSALVTRRSTAELFPLFPLISISGIVATGGIDTGTPFVLSALSADLDQRHLLALFV